MPINGLIKFLHVVFLFTLRQLVNFISFFMGQGYSTLPLRVSEYNTWIAHMKVISCSMPKGWPILQHCGVIARHEGGFPHCVLDALLTGILTVSKLIKDTRIKHANGAKCE